MERSWRYLWKQKTPYRTLPLAKDTIDALDQQKKKVGSSPWVFPGPTDGPMSPDSVLHMLHRVLKRAGLPRVRFHDLRHTFATLALQNGVDVKTVSGMLGHYSAGFTLDLQKFYKKLLSSGGVDRIESKHQTKGSSAKTVRNLQQISPRR